MFTKEYLEGLIKYGHEELYKANKIIDELELKIEQEVFDYSKKGVFERAEQIRQEKLMRKSRRKEKGTIEESLEEENNKENSRDEKMANEENPVEENIESCDDDEYSDEEYDEISESELLAQYYNLNDLRPVVTTKPGRLPFTHDPHLRLQKYREAWAKNAIPGASPHRKLRWQIRNAMNKQSNPVLKFVHKEQQQQKSEKPRKEWIP